MNKIMNKINFAIVMVMTSEVVAFAKTKRDPIKVEKGVCELITNLHDVFNILRILAFIGAAFYIASWAWGYIKAGEAKMDDVKKQGISLLVGFSALFLIGVALTFVMSAAGMDLLGCDIIKQW